MNLSSDQLKFDVNAEDFNSLYTRKFPIYFKYTNCELNNDWNVWLVRFWKKSLIHSLDERKLKSLLL